VILNQLYFWFALAACQAGVFVFSLQCFPILRSVGTRSTILVGLVTQRINDALMLVFFTPTRHPLSVLLTLSPIVCSISNQTTLAVGLVPALKVSAQFIGLFCAAGFRLRHVAFTARRSTFPSRRSKVELTEHFALFTNSAPFLPFRCWGEFYSRNFREERYAFTALPNITIFTPAVPVIITKGFKGFTLAAHFAQKDTIEEVKMQRDQAFAKLEETRKLLDEQREGRSGDAAQHRAEMEKLTRDFNALARKLASLENNL
jgi:hypothetical protein